MLFLQKTNCKIDNSKVDYYKSVKKLPLHCNCTNTLIETDSYFDLEFGISESCGMIQIISYPPDDILYSKPTHQELVKPGMDYLILSLTKLMNTQMNLLQCMK
jgi:hypothetical protein